MLIPSHRYKHGLDLPVCFFYNPWWFIKIKNPFWITDYFVRPCHCIWCSHCSRLSMFYIGRSCFPVWFPNIKNLLYALLTPTHCRIPRCFMAVVTLCRETLKGATKHLYHSKMTPLQYNTVHFQTNKYIVLFARTHACSHTHTHTHTRRNIDTQDIYFV